jgi:hypothetical protein
MLKRFRFLLVPFLIMAFCLTPALVLASCETPISTAEAIQCGANNAAGVPGGASPGNTINITVDNAINFISMAVGAVAVIMLIVGGFRYVTSSGSEESVKGAKNTIMYALIGLVIVAVAQIVVQFVLTKTDKSLNGNSTSSSSSDTSTGNTKSGSPLVPQ